ncbi:hypothetical protein [Alicyclobacillus dauci]|uniref:Uncharacterized protein n=1 Tax=Alicyclobacillus dauci TaxID=1475485 RepID=A0ABY6Z0U3_9BACL|nr:hypothetical protein [Alicyclobacillus dauci]WAH36492.1 hypothetical protein NZD86_20145 [Alicyclobacillus dauci]
MWKSVTETVRLREVADAVREIWYSYAEGFLPAVTGTVEDDKLYQLIDERMPRGWTASILPSGTVYASRPIFARKFLGVIVIEKRADGNQRVFEVAL